MVCCVGAQLFVPYGENWMRIMEICWIWKENFQCEGHILSKVFIAPEISIRNDYNIVMGLLKAFTGWMASFTT